MIRMNKILIYKYALMVIKFDLMGYPIEDEEDVSLHHVIIPGKSCPKKGFGKGKYFWNSAPLNKNTSHPYLHLVERFDKDRFQAITSELYDQIVKGHISYENLKAIDDILRSFERDAFTAYTKKPNIKEEYTKRIFNL